MNVIEIKNIDELLGDICGDEYCVKVFAASTPTSFRFIATRTDEYKQLREAIQAGLLSENKLKAFVSELLTEFKQCIRFPYEEALSTLAIALENYEALFALEYIRKLSELKLAEMPLAIHVAKDCLKRKPLRTIDQDFSVGILDEKQMKHLDLRMFDVSTVFMRSYGTTTKSMEYQNAVA